MTTYQPTPSPLSSPQRRCHLLLMFYLPGVTVTPEFVGRVNGVDDTIARADIKEAHQEITRYHRLSITTQRDGSYRIEGSALDQRLCLLHWLRRALRLCPQFIDSQFAPGLKKELKASGMTKALYDDTNLHALVNMCARRLNRQFDCRDIRFLSLFLQYCLIEHQRGTTPQFNEPQRGWITPRIECLIAKEIVHHWQRRVNQPPHDDERLFLAALFMILRVPDPRNDSQPYDLRLHAAIEGMIARFRELSGMHFSDEQGLRHQLYIHLAQALDRCHFGIGIDNSLPEEIHRLYPRLMRTTREAVIDIESDYGLHFSDDEIGLVAVIFGAWLMQDKDLQEKQVLLLTGNDSMLEQTIEQQLRELTLLPLNIKYQTLHAFQASGAPKSVTLIVTPYPTSLPLYSPPLIHVVPPLAERQQQKIREILEA
ncbi:stationary phase inducible protein CsiE [Salmonella enterica subsp. enterica serovar Choleraesuis]|nr:stationary phase inducible protein CsiE [Salmonella enterica subsp. enterica serovar Choleraesuis]